MTKELTDLMRYSKIKVIAEPGRQNLAWTGGTMLMQVSSGPMWITKDQYDRHGPKIVDNNLRDKASLVDAAAGSQGFLTWDGNVTSTELNDAFRRFDTNGDGTISEEELMAQLATFDPNMTYEKCRELFLSVDKNKNGELDPEEFTSVIMAHHHDVYGCDM